MIFKIILAHLFRLFFIIPNFKRHFFGIYQKWFIPHQLFKGLVLKRKLFDHLYFNLRIDDWIQTNLFFLGTYENAELTCFKKLIKDKTVFFDIGSNIGIYALNASLEMDSNSRIYAFEPFSSNIQSLQKNVENNQIENIQVVQKAVSDSKKTIDLFYNNAENNLGSVSAYNETCTEKETVSTITIDDFVVENHIHQVDFIKMDIEGAEYPALLGMKETISKFHPDFLIEIDPKLLSQTPYSVEQIEQYFFNFDYQKYNIEQDGSLTKATTKRNGFNYIFSTTNFK